MKIALVAHNEKKELMLEFVKKHKSLLQEHELFGTGTTGKMITDSTGLPVHRYNSGPLGGDQQIGSRVSEGKLDLVIFLRDPLTAQPHEPDVNALLRLCDVYEVPLATNITGARVMLKAIADGVTDFRALD